AATLTEAARCRLAHGLGLACKETHQGPASAGFPQIGMEFRKGQKQGQKQDTHRINRNSPVKNKTPTE
ncbi:MAG: hypothetical protein WBN36_05690, partial [Gammaproteobacteria bacterium]